MPRGFLAVPVCDKSAAIGGGGGTWVFDPICIFRSRSVECGGITVGGRLDVERADRTLLCDSLLVQGSGSVFEVGTATNRFLQKFTLTLKGLPSETVMSMGAKLLGAQQGGTIRIHGRDLTEWTFLGANAAVGATSITLYGTIHGTESTLVDNNFCSDHLGHGIFLEDGSERFNVITRNVVLGSMRPCAGEEVLQTDNAFNTIQNRSPSSFWITNPNISVLRTKPGIPTAGVYYIHGYKEQHQLPLIVRGDYLYTYHYESLPSTRKVIMTMDDASPGDDLLVCFKHFGNEAAVGTDPFRSVGGTTPYASSEFNIPGNFERWAAFGGFSNAVVTSGALGATSSNTDAQMTESNLRLSGNASPCLRVRMKTAGAGHLSPSDRFVWSVVPPAAGQPPTITMAVKTGRIYRIHSCTQLGAEGWQVVEVVQPVQDGVHVFTDSQSPGKRFYRVEVKLNP